MITKYISFIAYPPVSVMWKDTLKKEKYKFAYCDHQEDSQRKRHTHFIVEFPTASGGYAFQKRFKHVRFQYVQTPRAWLSHFGSESVIHACNGYYYNYPVEDEICLKK